MTTPAPTHSHPPGPVAELRRCPTCNRWGGKRDLDGDGVTVRLHPTEQRGACNEGPWHGSLRGPRNACGQWLQWIMIAAAADATTAQAARTGQSPPPSPAVPSPAVPSPPCVSSGPVAA
jgi:hypothetical protein